MLDVAAAGIGVVTAMAAPDALDALVVPGRAQAYRVASDEAMLLCASEVAAEVEREVTDRLRVGDDDAVVLDVTDGWTALTLSGDEARAAFAYLSRLELPREGFVQGEVVRVPAKVVVEVDRIWLLTPSMWEAHLRDRVRRRLAHLRPEEASGG